MGVDLPDRDLIVGVRPWVRVTHPGFDEGAVHRPDLRRAVCHRATRPGFRHHLQTAASHPVAMVAEDLVVIASPEGAWRSPFQVCHRERSEAISSEWEIASGFALATGEIASRLCRSQ